MSRGARTLLALSLVLSQLAAPATPRDLEAALEQLVDPGLPLVERAAAAEALAAPDAGLELAERRAELLADRALRDPAVELRAAALEALALVEGPRASVELARLVADLPDPEATRAAELLAERRTAARELLDLLHRGLGEDPLPGVRLAALLEGLGMAFALEGGPGDRVLFTRARMHGEAEVQDRAGAALEKALTRLASLRLDDRAVGLLEDLEGAPWPAAELGLRRSLYHITSGRDLEEALAAAARVQRETRGRLDHEGRRLRFLGLYTEALALFGLGRHHKVGGPLVRASLVLDGLAAERRDLLPVPEQPSVIMARRQAEVLEWRGAVELLGATVALAGGAETTDPRVLEHLRQAHEFSLWAQLREAAVDDKVGLSGFDVVLDGAWSPRRLVLSAPDNPVWSGDRRGAALELVLDLGEALALVLGEEMPGFVAPTAVPRSEAGEPLFGPPTSDPRRFALLKMMRPAQAMALQRRLDATWDLLEMRILEQRLRGLGEVIARDEASGWADLSDLRLPSIWGLFVVGDLRAEDRAEEAVELSVRLFDDLEASGSFDRAAWGAWLAARVEINQGSALGDAGRPRDAIRVLGSAAGRLEEVENTILERKRAERDPRALVIYDQQLAQTRNLRAQALVGQAVNSNVRLGDPEQALVYFEQAYELDQSEFMRGLLACYRARFGAVEEARALLRTVRPVPEVYYNLACAHALLGDLDRALEMLERELDANHPTPGARAKQKRWARQDPDLANLWEDERFVVLTHE